MMITDGHRDVCQNFTIWRMGNGSTQATHAVNLRENSASGSSEDTLVMYATRGFQAKLIPSNT